MLACSLLAATAAGPTLSSTLTPSAVCSGIPFNYVPISASDSVGFNWSRATVTGISNAAASGEGSIYETLVNTSGSPVTVTYQYILNRGSIADTQDVMVVVNPLPPVSFTVNNATQCVDGNSFQFTNTTTFGSGSLTYNWTFGDGDSSSAISPLYSYSGPGTYPVTLTALTSAGCSASSTTQSMTLNESPKVNFTYAIAGSPSSNMYYFAGRAEAGNGAALTYQWAFGDGNTATIQQPTHTYATNGSYSVIFTVTTAASAGGCPVSDTQLVTTNTASEPMEVNFTIAASQAQCLGSVFDFADVSQGITGTGVSYSWTFGDGTTGSGPTPTYQYAQPGDYIVTETVMQTIGATTFTQSASQSVSVYPVINNLTMLPSTSEVLCHGDQSTPIYFGPTNEGIHFTWTTTIPLAGAPLSGTGSFLPIFTAQNTTPNQTTTIITVTGTVPYGCGTGTAADTIIVNPVPLLSYGPTQSLCSGSLFNDRFLGSSLPGASITWTNEDPVIGLASSGAGTVIPGFIGTDYGFSAEIAPLLVTASLQGCSSTQTIHFTVNPLPSLDTAVAPPDICSGTVLNYTPTGYPTGYSYTWTRAMEMGIQQPANSGSGPTITETLTNLTSVSLGVPYQIALLSPAGCINQEQIVDTVNPSPTVTFTLDSSQTICSGVLADSVPLTGPVSGTTFSWMASNPAIGLSSATGTGTVPSFQTLDPMNTVVTSNFLVTATSPAGCMSVAPATFADTVNPVPIYSVSSPEGTVFCPGDSLSLLATGASGYQWYQNGSPLTGDTLSDFGASFPGNYFVTAISNQGCRDSTEVPVISVTVIPQPIVGFSFTTPVCAGVPVTFTNTSSPPSGYSLTYQWSDNAGDSSTAINPTFTYDTAGIYNVTLVAIPGNCATAAGNTTEQVSILVPGAGVTLPTVATEAGRPVLLITPGGYVSTVWSPATGLSNPEATDPTATLEYSQKYTIEDSSATGCITIDTIQVEVIPVNTVYIPNAFTPNGDGINDLFVIAGLSYYPGSSLVVYDRWGRQVYYAASYQNDWNGGKLPVGTYIYILQLKTMEGYKMYKGLLSLIK